MKLVFGILAIVIGLEIFSTGHGAKIPDQKRGYIVDIPSLLIRRNEQWSNNYNRQRPNSPVFMFPPVKQRPKYQGYKDKSRNFHATLVPESYSKHNSRRNQNSSLLVDFWYPNYDQRHSNNYFANLDSKKDAFQYKYRYPQQDLAAVYYHPQTTGYNPTPSRMKYEYNQRPGYYTKTQGYFQSKQTSPSNHRRRLPENHLLLSAPHIGVAQAPPSPHIGVAQAPPSPHIGVVQAPPSPHIKVAQAPPLPHREVVPLPHQQSIVAPPRPPHRHLVAPPPLLQYGQVPSPPHHTGVAPPPHRNHVVAPQLLLQNRKIRPPPHHTGVAPPPHQQSIVAPPLPLHRGVAPAHSGIVPPSHQQSIVVPSTPTHHGVAPAHSRVAPPSQLKSIVPPSPSPHKVLAPPSYPQPASPPLPHYGVAKPLPHHTGVALPPHSIIAPTPTVPGKAQQTHPKPLVDITPPRNGEAPPPPPHMEVAPPPPYLGLVLGQFPHHNPKPKPISLPPKTQGIYSEQRKPAYNVDISNNISDHKILPPYENKNLYEIEGKTENGIYQQVPRRFWKTKGYLRKDKTKRSIRDDEDHFHNLDFDEDQFLDWEFEEEENAYAEYGDREEGHVIRDSVPDHKRKKRWAEDNGDCQDCEMGDESEEEEEYTTDPWNYDAIDSSESSQSETWVGSSNNYNDYTFNNEDDDNNEGDESETWNTDNNGESSQLDTWTDDANDEEYSWNNDDVWNNNGDENDDEETGTIGNADYYTDYTDEVSYAPAVVKPRPFQPPPARPLPRRKPGHGPISRHPEPQRPIFHPSNPRRPQDRPGPLHGTKPPKSHPAQSGPGPSPGQGYNYQLPIPPAPPRHPKSPPYPSEHLQYDWDYEECED